MPLQPCCLRASFWFCHPCPQASFLALLLFLLLTCLQSNLNPQDHPLAKGVPAGSTGPLQTSHPSTPFWGLRVPTRVIRCDHLSEHPQWQRLCETRTPAATVGSVTWAKHQLELSWSRSHKEIIFIRVFGVMCCMAGQSCSHHHSLSNATCCLSTSS